MHDVDKKIPVKFEQIDQIDDRFQKVKIWLMHLGKNYNNSVFTKEAVLNAMESLKNTPILGYVEESRIGDKDFRGHETELIVSNGELKTKYIGQAFGVIPTDSNPRFESKLGDENEMLEYLVVDGLLWTKFDDAISILNQNREVNQSMELHDTYDGYFNDEGAFVFTKFSFYGACMLGSDVLPAMQRASVEKVFSTDVIKEEIARKLEEYYQAFSKKQEEVFDVEDKVEAVEVVEVVETVEVEQAFEQETDNTIDATEDSQEVAETVEEVTETVEVTEDFEAEKETVEEEVTEVVEEVEDQEQDFKIAKVQYEAKISELESEVELLHGKVTSLESEKTELELFRSTIFKAQHESDVEELFSKFSKLDEDDIKDIRENLHEYTLEKVESMLFERLGRKIVTSFAKGKSETSNTRMKVIQPDIKSENGYSHYFEKHGVTAQTK